MGDDTRATDAAGVPHDRFGNPIDPRVGYARGRILASEVEEVRRQAAAHAIMRDRYARFGYDGVFNLTGLIRGYPFAPGDPQRLASYVHFHASGQPELERLALERMEGDAARHDGFLANRVSAGILATMLTLLKRGDRVVSLVPADRSHPSIKQSVDAAGGVFEDVVGVAAFEQALSCGAPPALVAITTITPSKNHLPACDALRAIGLARARGALVMLDDAHMAARITLYDEPASFGLGDPEVAVWSLDKHVPGPRSGFVGGRRDLIARIRARAMSLGLEAQIGPYLAGMRAVQAFDPAPILKAKKMSERVLSAIQPEIDGRAYLAGAGVAVSGEDFLEVALRRANEPTTTLVPIEAMAFTALEILAQFGAVTIPATGMPGAACTFRLMMYPDGERFGERNMLEATRFAMQSLIANLRNPEGVRSAVSGS